MIDSEPQKSKLLVAEKGFSLMELMIVMVILGLLASLVGPTLFNKVGKANQGTATTQIAMLLGSLDAYRLDVGHYPSEEDGLQALVTDPGDEKWDGPYLKKGVPQDPWGTPYHYQNPGEHQEIDIFTYGSDNRPDGEKEKSDIGSWM